MTGLPLARRDLLALGLVVAAMTTVALAVKSARWYGSWGELASALENATTLTYPVIGGWTAFVVSGPRRRRYVWMVESARRTTLDLLARVTVTIAGVSGLASVAVAITAYVVNAREATFGGPVVLSVLTIACGNVLAAAVGTIIGAYLPAVLSPVVAVVVIYVVEFLADTGKPSLAPFAGLVVADPRERTFLYTVPWVYGVRSAWLLCTALLLLCLAAKEARRMYMALGLSCLLASVLISVGTGGMKVDGDAMKPVCRRPAASVEICLTAARAHTAGTVWRAVRPEIAGLNGLTGRWRFEEESIASTGVKMSGDELTVPFGIVNGVEGNGHVVNAKELQASISTTLLQNDCRDDSTPQSGRPRASVNDVIQRWLLTRLGVPTSGTVVNLYYPTLSPNVLDYSSVSDFASSWRSASAADRRAWLAANGARLLACDISVHDTRFAPR